MTEILAPLPTIVAPPNNAPYLWVVGIAAVSGLLAAVAIAVLRPTATDNLQLITTILGFVATTTAALLAFMKAQETHLSVNSRLDAFMQNSAVAARAQGYDEGRIHGRAEANERTDALASDTRNAVATVAAAAAGVLRRAEPQNEPPVPSVKATFTGTITS